jgi:cytidylate kinase
MTASANTRAQRRFEELQQKGDSVSFDEVLKNVEERDYIDTHRDDSPLLKDKNAIEIDNSFLTREEQFDKVLTLVQNIP